MNNKTPRILIFSNNAASKTESNGRIHMTHFLKFTDIHNFYIRGNPDVEGINYLTLGNAGAVKTKLGWKADKLITKSAGCNEQQNVPAASQKTKKPIFHLLRNMAYTNNKSLLKFLNNYIKSHDINAIVLWGCNLPFLYELSYKLSVFNSIPLFTITSEDYPLKTYNYISKKPSFFFRIFQKSLRKWCLKVYKQSALNIYSNEELKNLYETQTKSLKSEVVFFGSDFVTADLKINNSKKVILYGGNLYRDRLESILELAKYLEKRDDVVIKLFGSVEKGLESKVAELKNVVYGGLITYFDLLNEINRADFLLHVEGFSQKYISDCKYAFSTKIADYIMSGKPLIIYGPKEISGIKFCLKFLKEFTITNKNELNKIENILSGNHEISSLIRNMFSLEKVSSEIYSLFEKNI